MVGYKLVDELSEDGTRTTQIELVFSKNVVNLAVTEKIKHVLKCISKDDGVEIPIQVQMADDQIEKKREISLPGDRKAFRTIESLSNYNFS